MKIISKKEEKNKVGRPKLADMGLKKKSYIIIGVMILAIIGLLAGGLISLNVLPKYNKLKGEANINLCTADNINPEVLYNEETNPNGFSPEFLSAVMSNGSINWMSPGYNDSGKCSTITMEELRQITRLHASNSSLTNTLGLQNLTNLYELNLGSNQLTSIDLSGLTNLTHLNLYNNQLTSVEGLSDLTNLKDLYLDNNQLTSIDLSGLTNLTHLNLYNNQLTSIEGIQNLTNLRWLNLSNTQLRSIDLSGLTNLYTLYLNDNELTSIDVSGLANLQILYLNDNKLTSIDVSKNTKLRDLYIFKNNISGTLDLSQNPNLIWLYAQHNNIDEIKFYNKADDEEKEYSDVILNHNNIKTLDLSGIDNIDLLILDNNPINKLYMLKGTKKDYSEIFKLNENIDATYEINNKKILSYKNNIITALKYGEARLTISSDSTVSFPSEFFDKAFYCDFEISREENEEQYEKECSWLEDLNEEDFYLPYFMYTDIYVYNVTSDEYKIDTENKIIDAQNKKFSIKNINLHLADLEGIVEGNNFIIKDGDTIVDTYEIINVKKEEPVVTTIINNSDKITTSNKTTTTTKKKVRRTTKKVTTTSKVETKETTTRNIINAFKSTTTKVVEEEKKNNICIYIIPIIVILVVGYMIYRKKKTNY